MRNANHAGDNECKVWIGCCDVRKTQAPCKAKDPVLSLHCREVHPMNDRPLEVGPVHHVPVAPFACSNDKKNVFANYVRRLSKLFKNKYPNFPIDIKIAIRFFAI